MEAQVLVCLTAAPPSEAKVEDEGVRGILAFANTAGVGIGLSNKQGVRVGAGNRVGSPESMLYV